MVTVSVISHMHCSQIMGLLKKIDLLCVKHVRHVVLTVNVPEPELEFALQSMGFNFFLTVVFNSKPKGFGENHNAAFRISKSEYFCVINPDIEFSSDPFSVLIFGFTGARVGCSFPVQVDENGEIQDYARRLPSPLAIFTRYTFPKKRRLFCEKPDWVNGAFMVFSREVFAQLRGFDERYFMYCEDVDICIRLTAAGYRLCQTDVVVTHLAHRDSRVKWRHLLWHVRSLVRLWFSGPYWRFTRTGSSERII